MTSFDIVTLIGDVINVIAADPIVATKIMVLTMNDFDSVITGDNTNIHYLSKIYLHLTYRTVCTPITSMEEYWSDLFWRTEFSPRIAEILLDDLHKNCTLSEEEMEILSEEVYSDNPYLLLDENNFEEDKWKQIMNISTIEPTKKLIKGRPQYIKFKTRNPDNGNLLNNRLNSILTIKDGKIDTVNIISKTGRIEKPRNAFKLGNEMHRNISYETIDKIQARQTKTGLLTKLIKGLANNRP